MGQGAALELRENHVLVGAKVPEHSQNRDLERVDALSRKDRSALTHHAGTDLIEGQRLDGE